MSFDGVLLNKLAKEFNILKTGRISKIIESGDTDFIFTIRANRTNYNLMASFSPDFARIHLTNKQYESIGNPKSFTMLLRKHIEGYFILDIKTFDSDRIIYFILEGFNEMQDKSRKYLFCEVMGRYSNLVLTDENFKIIDALKHDGVGEYNRTILPNAKYVFPDVNKINPFSISDNEIKNIIKEKNLNSPKDYMDTFNGVSLNLAYPIFEYDDHASKFIEYLNKDVKPSTFINFKGKLDFYYNPFNYKVIDEYDSISSLLDNYYYKKDLDAKIKLKTNDLDNFIKKQITKNEKKIEKLNKELAETDKFDLYKLYGELLLSIPNLKEKKKEVSVFNYYNNEYVNIPLDIKYTILDNSNKYFKKYQKAKSSISYINEQIKISTDEIEYFNLLKYQLENASFSEALEIQDELIDLKYLFKPKTNTKKNHKPKLLTYIVDDTLISVGKNNIQNEYLTHKLAKQTDMWFHIKDGSGSHVVVHKDGDLSENLIRTAAALAAYHSSFKDSSSVAVDYTRIKNIKKIPGKRACFVSYKNQKTIYIDPDKSLIDNLKEKK